MAVSRTRQLPIGVTQIDKADGIQTGQVTVNATGGGTVVLFGTEFSATPRMIATDTDSAAGVIAMEGTALSERWLAGSKRRILSMVLPKNSILAGRLLVGG